MRLFLIFSLALSLYADKFLVFVISPDEELQTLWQSHMDSDPEHVEAHFIRETGSGTLNQTILSMEAFLPRLKEFNYVLRTELSPSSIFPRLLDHLKTLPKTDEPVAKPQFQPKSALLPPSSHPKNDAFSGTPGSSVPPQVAYGQSDMSTCGERESAPKSSNLCKKAGFATGSGVYSAPPVYHLTDQPIGSGSAILLSPDLVELIVAHKHQLLNQQPPTHIVLGFFLLHYGISLSPFVQEPPE